MYLIPFSLALIIFSQPDKSKRFWNSLIICFTASLLVDLSGIVSGIIFGPYTFGDTLGPKFAGVPWLMPVYWVLLFYSTAAFFKNFEIKGHTARALCGAFLMVMFDLLIEPVAIRYNYWNWSEMMVPLQRYFAVFIFAFIVLRLFYHSKFKKSNVAASVFVFIHLLFYAALNLWAF